MSMSLGLAAFPADGQDAYALRSQQRTAAAQQRGAFDDEIVPVETNMLFTDKALGKTQERAVTLSKDGSSQLYLINADGSNVQRLASSGGIDTEANFAPDGRSILFTSDRGGSPQIYRLTLASGAVERMTYEGSYNVSPRHLPDGKGFVFVRREGGRFNIALQDFATRQMQILTQGSLDESPSVAPNGKLIIYASEVGGRGILAAVSSDGRVKQRLTAAASDVREPAWGPLLK